MSFQVQMEGGPAGQLDSQTKLFLDEISKLSTPATEISPEDIRSKPSPTFPYNMQPAEVFTEDIFITARDGYEIMVRIYRQDISSTAPPLMYYHGGCWVFCSVNSHDSICRRLCKDSGLTVFSVDYRLAPESKFPTGVHDAYDAARYVSQNRVELKITRDELIVSGDSAGGNLATVVALMAKELEEFRIRGQLLYYPITDASRMDNESYTEFAFGHFLTKELMAFGAYHYSQSSSDLENPLVSPLLSNNLEDMPRTLIQTAEFDVLRDEAEAYAVKLASVGVAVECVRYNGLIHGYAGLAGKIDPCRKAIADSVEFLRSFKPESDEK